MRRLHRPDLVTIDLAPRSSLFHGTDRVGWDPAADPILVPAWFGDLVVATDYALMRRSADDGDPFVVEYRTNRCLRLLDLGGEALQEIMESLYDVYIADEIATEVIRMGYDGWYIPNVEVMIGDAEALSFVSVHDEGRRISAASGAALR